MDGSRLVARRRAELLLIPWPLVANAANEGFCIFARLLVPIGIQWPRTILSKGASFCPCIPLPQAVMGSHPPELPASANAPRLARRSARAAWPKSSPQHR
ncbi:MAG: hypothetical protein J3K34DRAFT_408452 [Monoraphidium minutum]|nr:MAG: hypothetical protein J3K34DRAFT_408452 [Monoraphidium minutum]